MSIKITDYFKEDIVVKKSTDWDEINKIRDKLNSFEYKKEAYKWLDERRQSCFNRYEDKRLFDIDENDILDYSEENKVNKYHKDKLDYYKRGIDGNVKYNKDGSKKEYGKINKMLINYYNNHSRNKNLLFLIKNFNKIIIISIILLIILLFLFISIYIIGILNSLGHTPFVLCGEKEISGESVVQLPSAQVEEMCTPEYASKIFISVAKSKGWKDEAIVGTLSYILQEGSGMGTFSYEGWYIWNGPSGVKFDKTLNNKKWLEWLPREGKEQAHSYYAANTTRYAAIGLGLLQESDVWNTSGPEMDDNGATRLINYAESKNKPWQDPQTQMDYFFDEIFTKSNAFDTPEADPKKDNRSPEEWCRRVSAGVGMPAWNWTTNNSYMLAHIRHLDEAKKLFKDFTGVDIGSLDQQTKNLCEGADSIITGGNATIADAAVTLASGDNKKSKILWDEDGENSKNLNDQRLKTYKKIHIELFQGDIHFASCDRGAATAIRWSSADKTFPAGGTSQQYDYLKNSEKWNYIGDYGKIELKPGDVLITKGDGHIKIYVGNDAVKKRFPESDADMYAASFQQYFPVLYKDVPGYDNREYAVFRNVNPDKK